ncbi:formate/nitrite transporter family protein [Listeria sp. PSOL-1]|uniref:formate/nitrite transporter family protein n=1 Tax=Listeria sp. PSOL-1 TaxID=1844999 RepID=UPI0013D3E02F|nr:formate/nitrite transporter family protein [Listeria sp. PSOL-1]
MDIESSPLMQKIDYSTKKKVDLANNHIIRYIVRAMLACLFLTLGTAVAVMIGDKVDHFAHGLGKILYAFMFSWSLVMIIYMNAELGTSNMMYMTTGVYQKLVRPGKALKVLFLCIFFNLIGGIIAGYIMSLTSAFHALPADHFLFTAVSGKLAKAPLQIFVEGIFANIVVNTAVLCTLRMKDDAAKVLSMIFIIFIFAFLGFEHVIANFSSFSLAFFASGGHLAGMTPGSVITNLVLAMLGNYVGGGLVIGLGYAWLNRTPSIFKD